MHQLQRDIARLLDVQERERELLALEEEKAALPEALEGAKAAIKKAEGEVERLKGEFKVLQVKKKDLELESSGKIEAVAKYQKQQFDVKTNAEYQALQKEIVNRQVENSRIEDGILETMMEIEEHEGKIKAGEDVVKDRGLDLAAQEKRVAEEGARIEARIAALRAERDALLPGIDDSVLRRYQRIFRNKRDMAVVPLTGYVCGGCHMHLPPQIAHLVRKGDELVICESCSRILYWAEGLVDKGPAAGAEPGAEPTPAPESVGQVQATDPAEQAPVAEAPAMRTPAPAEDTLATSLSPSPPEGSRS